MLKNFKSISKKQIFNSVSSTVMGLVCALALVYKKILIANESATPSALLNQIREDIIFLAVFALLVSIVVLWIIHEVKKTT